MIKLNQNQNNLYTLVCATSDDLKNEAISLTSEIAFLNQDDKKFYLKVNLTKKDVRKELENQLTEFVKNNKYDVDVDVDSFIKTLNSNKQMIFNTIVETITITSHKKYSLKTINTNNHDVKYNLVTTDKELINSFDTEMIKAEFVNYARDLQDTPPNIATSVYLADKIANDAKNIKNLKVTVYGLKELQEMNMGLILSVNAASHIEPRMVVLEYVSDPSIEKTVLVGKGITFDSGGYNLKSSLNMKNMKFDMSGAAIMLSTVMSLAKNEAKANVAAIGMFTDNRIGGHGTLTESVIKSYDGLTVQIDNTDAEGRLVLGDGISYAVKDLKADKIIDMATLTGAMLYSLGVFATGVFSQSDEMYAKLEQASTQSGERIWRLPIYEEHFEVMKNSEIADLTNTGSGITGAGSSTAAAFLNIFAKDVPYLHLDIASTADHNGRGTGVMLRTLFEMLNK